MCGDTCFDFNDTQLSLATCTCFARSDWTLSALSRPPCTLGKKAVAPFGSGPLSHAWRACRAIVVSGVARSFRPLPTHRTWAPAPRWTSLRSRPISSERRKPVWAATSSNVDHGDPAKSSDRARRGSTRSQGVSGSAPVACRGACSVWRVRAGSAHCVPAPRTTRTGRRSGWQSGGGYVSWRSHRASSRDRSGTHR
jgi:hypothetical protein